MNRRMILLATLALFCTGRGMRAAEAIETSPAAGTERPSGEARPALKSPIGFMKGYTWGWYAGRGELVRPQAAESMKALADVGCNWVEIPICGHMTTSHSPEIAWGDADKRSPSDAELRQAIGLAPGTS